MSTHEFTVYDIFQRNAQRCARDIAVTSPGGNLSFQELLEQVDLLAGGLAARGINKGDRIAVLAMNHLEYLLLYGAAAAMGAVLVPVNWRLSLDEISYILNDSGARMLFFDDSQSRQVRELTSSHRFNGTTIAFFESEKKKLSWTDLMDTPAAHFPSENRPVGSDLFCLIYTAAVDGNPKGAALSHENMVISNLQTGLTMGLTDADVYLNMVPLFHITGMNLALTTLHTGGKNVIMEKFDAPRVIDLAHREGVTLLASFPPILSTLLGQMTAGDLSSINHVTGFDAPETIDSFCKQTGARFWVLYGQSETAGFVTLSDYALMPGAAGKACPVTRLAILNDDDEILPCDTPGEIGVKGPVVFQGYWQKDGTLDRSTCRNDWHHTGDMGRLDTLGYLWFEGRKPEKELIKPGGENVYPAEVEKVILTHPDIEEVCIIGVPDAKFGEAVKAVCLKKKNSLLDAPTLIAYVGERIARYKKPGRVEFIATPLPRKTDGAVDRIKVKQLYSDT